MQDTNASSQVTRSGRTEDALSVVTHAPKRQIKAAAETASSAKPRSWFVRLVQCIARLFGRKQPKPVETETVIRIADTTVADRAAAARAAQMSPPMAFVGDTASTLATPMGAYAGKPVDQANRKRAEQQFRNMDVSQATMN